MVEKQLVFGHKAPDTDALVASMAQAYLQNQLGQNVEAVALGKPNAETKFVFDYFNQSDLPIITKIPSNIKKVMLVDHNEPEQSVANLANATVTNVVDHHRIANFNTKAPISYRAEPVGSTSTILQEIYSEKKVTIPPKLAGLMLAGVLSDTLLLKSPTTTSSDKKAVSNLSKLAGIKDYKQFGTKLLRAGTNVADKTAADIVNGDAKLFTFGKYKVKIGQVNVVAFSDILQRLPEIKQLMEQEVKMGPASIIMLIITDILTNNSKLLVVGKAKNEVAKVFGKALDEDDLIDLPNVVSRKKQVVPPLDAKLSQ